MCMCVLQKAFLQSRSISLVDMYIDNSEPSENVGQIHFSLEYDFQNSTLILRIIQVSRSFVITRFASWKLRKLAYQLFTSASGACLRAMYIYTRSGTHIVSIEVARIIIIIFLFL